MPTARPTPRTEVPVEPTPTQQRRERRHAARRDEVLAAAMEIVAAEGVEALTIARLAANLGVSVGSLYRYFPSKAAVLVGLQQVAIAGLAEELQDAVQASRTAFTNSGSRDAAEGALRHIVAVLRPIVRHALERPDRHRLIDELLSAPAPLLSDEELAEVNRALVPLLDLVATLFHEAELAGALGAGDPQQRTRVTWAALHGLDHLRKRDRVEPKALQVAALSEVLVRTLLVGFGAMPARVEVALR